MNSRTPPALNINDQESLLKLKELAKAQASNQSLGIFKANEAPSEHGNFLIPVLPPPERF